jgi:MFS transporter, PAT family, beta-lactamase induction signal transducer AmpG
LANMAGQDPAGNLFAVAVGALFIAFCAATQDIAIDAWRIESAPPEMQGGMAAAYQLGYRTAVMVGTAGALWIAADYGWHLSYAAMALLMSVGMATTLMTREPEAEPSRISLMQEQRVVEWLARRTHWPESLRQLGATFIGAVVCPLVDFFARFGAMLGVLIFAFVCTYRLTDYAMGVMANPFYLDHGYTLKEVATVVKFFGLFASILGVLVGGTVVAKLGIARALVAGSLLVIGSNLGFALLATTGSPTLIGLALVNSFDNLALGVHGTALIAFLSSLTSARYTATQYAVLSSLYALPGKLLMGVSGLMVEMLDYPAFFVYTASLSLPGLLLLFWLMRRDALRFR